MSILTGLWGFFPSMLSLAQFKTGRRFVQMLCFPFTFTADAGYFVVRDGDKTTLSCGDARGPCQHINWLFVGISQDSVVSLVEEGNVCQKKKSAIDPSQLSVRTDCSLEIMNVSVKDVGLYTCRQHRTTQDFANDQLSVVTCKYYYTYIITIYCKY